jgi:GT2 family glycosyltransferase
MIVKGQSMKRITLGPEVSIGISAYGNAGVTRHCLNCLLDSADGDFELILVDDCSPDNGEILRLFRSILPRHRNTKLFSFTLNLEYSGSLNCILSHATGEFVVFISNDIYVAPHYLSELIAVAKSDDSIGIVRGVSNFVDNEKSTHNIDISRHIKTLADVPQFSAFVHEAKRGTVLIEDYLTGDAFLVKRSVIDAIGTLDPAFYGYFADHDYGIRVCREGFKLAVAQGAFAFHHCAANFDYLPDARRQQKLEARYGRIHENWARFKLKYGLPVNLLYSGMNAIDWGLLNTPVASDVKGFHVPPGDYSEYLLNPSG